MANPLTLYVPIKQDTDTQNKAKAIYALFMQSVGAGLNKTGNVHYARLAIMHVKPFDTTTPIQAILLITEFDKDMETYLDVFWSDGVGIKEAFMALYGLMLDEYKDPKDPTDPAKFDFGLFVKFIKGKNLTNDITQNYSAYPQLVTEIWRAFHHTA